MLRLRAFCTKPTGERISGTVKWFDRKKGFGFIVPDAESSIKNEVFVHQSNIVSATGFRSLVEGLRVSFICRPDHTGKVQAVGVTSPNGEPVQLSQSKK